MNVGRVKELDEVGKNRFESHDERGLTGRWRAGTTIPIDTIQIPMNTGSRTRFYVQKRYFENTSSQREGLTSQRD